MADPLSGMRVVVPETREMEVLARMLERQGAEAIRCPLVAIIDAPDPAPIEAWLRRFIAAPPQALILLTGEGLTRLLGVATRAGIEAEFRAALAGVRRICRGPKPVARLRAQGLSADLAPEPPTTAGIIAALETLDLKGHRIAVQLYPDNPNTPLLEAIRAAGATPDAVLPYAYASKEDDARVLATLREMADGRIDLIVFTSTPQLRRLTALAEPALLRAALRRTRIAAVGPVVAAAVREAGGEVAVMPEESFHMKPMVTAILAALDSGGLAFTDTTS
ncbi:uroporphyrinogen-III synthase [Siccirubricoccus sp. KC 17139]|uniref:Uroporphyrinogen-III synthase n=1 Tax=Siccirubricoccus soli TaxID=2899147 RepID=A0ABT1D696_9PROT|nr:uroporphyrinogen-III synthase [Siccirubricoccus soli]MCO6417463.1 uroporphyrinogen-III synthase [Siccirubricoccus soli]MCP2683598.1 uroporphyrinogen-III synthase [Siccirubricoccus soli]